MATDKSLTAIATERISAAFNALFSTKKKDPKASGIYGGAGYRNIFSLPYTGEKNLGEIGPIKDYLPDYYALSLRSWQAFTESEMATTILSKFILWIVSKGLKLQANPEEAVLSSEGISIAKEAFNNISEARFGIWARSKRSSFSKMDNLHELAKIAMKNSKIGGDVLVVLRYINNCVNVQLIDGCHVQSPTFGNDYFAQQLDNGNYIRNGIEMTEAGEHIAYHVRQKDFKMVRIEAKSAATGLTVAFLVYGNKHRIDNYRGMPMIAVCLETLKKLERYKEATVGSAEERAKIILQIVHSRDSTGENPMGKQMAKAFDAEAYNGAEDLPITISGEQLANTVAATTNKSAYNMPVGAEMKAIESKNELMFKEFYSTNADIICAAVGIPPNVAFSMYNDSFSASRAATKDWEHTITVNREDFTFQFYQPIYNFWQYTEILKSKIQAAGYIKAFNDDNFMAVEAFQNARFTGPMFPHIDPKKEVEAERLKLGSLADVIPLTTVEAATEALNGGDSRANMDQFSEELEEADELGIKPAPVVVTPPVGPLKEEEKVQKETEQE